MARLAFTALALLALIGVLGAAPVVYRFDLHDDMIDPATVFYFTRGYARAEAASADAVIIDIDTPGGRVDSTIQIRNRIFESPIPTYTYVRSAISGGALVALGTDGIYMAPNSKIGGAQPILGTGEALDETLDEKMTSILRAEVRSTLRELARVHPGALSSEELEYRIRLAEAFITPPEEDIVSLYNSPEVVCRSGELLTLDGEEAVRERLADGRAESWEEVLRALGLEGAEVREVDLTWSEELARFLSKTTISSLLLLVGLLGIYIEFKTPGFGLPGIVGIAALTLFFFGQYVADLSTLLEPLLVLAGIIFLGVEIFMLPGFGLTGIVGILLIVTGLLMALVKLPPPEFEVSMLYFDQAVYALAAIFVLLGVTVVILAKYLPRTSIWRHLELQPALISAPGVALPPGAEKMDRAQLTGQVGRALTDLRPAGSVEIEGQPFDVVTQGEFIERGTRVRVIQVTGNRVVVAEVPPIPQPLPPQGGEGEKAQP